MSLRGVAYILRRRVPRRLRRCKAIPDANCFLQQQAVHGTNHSGYQQVDDAGPILRRHRSAHRIDEHSQHPSHRSSNNRNRVAISRLRAGRGHLVLCDDHIRSLEWRAGGVKTPRPRLKQERGDLMSLTTPVRALRPPSVAAKAAKEKDLTTK
ncbi:hypothetical protein LY78DRAFT_228057 [Colletotrichum sublineola]|nr:hypothetical protein LY78DRAFT_228057 [Colletotrichum sublineola]